MRKVEEKQHIPISTGSNVLVTDREWVVKVVPQPVGQRSVRDKEWLEDLKIFGIGTDGKKIIN
jgi:hypothetical protein